MGIIDWVKRNILGITYEQIAQDAADYTPRYLTGHDRSAEKFLQAAQKVADAQQGTVIVQQVPEKAKRTRNRKTAEVKQYLPDLSSMTKKALLEFAAGKGIEVDGKKKKGEVHRAISKALVQDLHLFNDKPR